jgi:hypothetical protein
MRHLQIGGAGAQVLPASSGSVDVLVGGGALRGYSYNGGAWQGRAQCRDHIGGTAGEDADALDTQPLSRGGGVVDRAAEPPAAVRQEIARDVADGEEIGSRFDGVSSRSLLSRPSMAGARHGPKPITLKAHPRPARSSL